MMNVSELAATCYLTTWLIIQFAYAKFLARAIRRSQERWPVWLAASVVATAPPAITWAMCALILAQLGASHDLWVFALCASPVALAASLLVVVLPPRDSMKLRQVAVRVTGVLSALLSIVTVLGVVSDK